MENIFNKTGYSINFEKAAKNNATLKLLSINNPDGTIRWIWNANCTKPIFLKFYNVGSKRALLFTIFIKFIFIFKLQNLVFKKKVIHFSKLENQLFDINEDWALFTGTVGPNNKAILFANNSFYKIATNSNAQKLINHEHEILRRINQTSTSFITPQTIKVSSEIIQLNDISKNGKRVDQLSSCHYEYFIDMNKIAYKIVNINDWEYFITLKKEFETINDKRIPKNIIRKINTILNSIPNDEIIELSLSHGDFTQWNMFDNKGKLSIYDWELASLKPKGFDFFHFIIQNKVLVSHKSWKEIYSDINHFSKDDFHKKIFNNNLIELHKYLKWYVLINCLHYLKVYSSQLYWHIQVEWLIQTWNEALNVFLHDNFNSRELIIMDLFDAIQNQEYAALKFQNGFPEKLSSYSDIDLVINKKMNSKISSFLKNHSLVSKITTNNRSFMNSIQVFTDELSILSVDLIWQLKRKNLEILNAKKIIEDNYINSYGVKNASTIDIARYVVLFYILNGAKIPKKFLVYEDTLCNSRETIDLTISEYFTNKSLNKNPLLNIIKKYNSNRKLHFLKNTFNYMIDIFKNVKKSNGFTVTISGVDGAGKSTVIENLAYQIEKQFRRQVVVLRHRPSILPILSVWSKGKEKAHLDTVSHLPRQGNNNSTTSSLLRFTYYFSDYLLGQFVIYFKYIIKGHVVIYDRYYFDFINDSKRSNIVLSKKIPRIGYYFLLKPKFNFFLFADTNTILNRKRELSKETIEFLTNDYKHLFSSLQSKSNSAIYMPINNIDLESTLTKIINTVKSA